MKKQINDMSHILRWDGKDSMPTGVIMAANDSQFAGTHFVQPLTDYLQGWQKMGEGARIKGVIDSLFPSLPTLNARRYEFKKAVESEFFVSELDDEITPEGEFKRLEFTGQMVYGKTINRGLTIRVKHDDVSDYLPGSIAAGAPTSDWREFYVEALTSRLYRNELRRGITLLSTTAAANGSTVSLTGVATTNNRSTVTCDSTAGVTPGSLITGITALPTGTQVITVVSGTSLVVSYAATATSSGGTATANNSAVIWNNTPNSAANPDRDLRLLVKRAEDTNGYVPTNLVMGRDAWQARLDVYENPTSASGVNNNVKSGYDESKLANYLQIDKVIVPRVLYRTGTADPKKQIVGSEVYAYYVEPNPLPSDPSNVKTFRSRTMQGGELAVYVNETPKWTDITVEFYSSIVATNPLGLFKLAISPS